MQTIRILWGSPTTTLKCLSRRRHSGGCDLRKRKRYSFLASLVGENGRVFGFDIQDKAIANTTKKLTDLNLIDRVTLIKDGHQNMDKYIDCPVKAVMFNLGYLPSGDHSISTRPETTIQALSKAMELLVTGAL